MKYLCDPHILPTNTCPPDFGELTRRSTEFAEYAIEAQLDIADGIFAPVTSWPYNSGQWEDAEVLLRDTKLSGDTSIRYEVHLMVKDPGPIGEMLARAGAIRLIPHIEALPEIDDARELFARWRAAGVEEIGIAMRIDTPLEALDPYIHECAVVQLMSIAKIGAQGQPFDDRALSRVEELHARYPELLVAVDGGITESNVEELVRAGANRLCVGSALSKSENAAAAFARMHDRAMRGCTPLELESAV